MHLREKIHRETWVSAVQEMKMNYDDKIKAYTRDNPHADTMGWTKNELHGLLDWAVSNGFSFSYLGIKHHEEDK